MQDEGEGKLDVEGVQGSITEPVTEAMTEKAEYICDVCGKVFDNENSLLMHRLRSHKLPTKEEGVGVEAPKPPEVEAIEEAIAFIKERLAQVYGVGKNDRIIVKALEDDPTPLRDGNLLHAFIKSLAPRAYDAHLSTSVIKPLYVRFPNLAQAVDKYLGGAQPQQVPYAYPPSPQQTYGYTFYYPHPIPQVNYPFYPPSTYAPHYPHFAFQPKPPKTYKIVVEGQEIETDESGFMAWQRFLREKEEDKRKAQEHELTMKKLEAEIKKIAEETGKGSEPTVPIKIGDREVQVPAYLAPLYLKGDEESKKEIEKLREELHRKEIEALQRDLEELKKRPGFFEELRSFQEIAPMLGFQKGGRTTADLLDSLAERLDQRAAQLLNKIPAPGGEWKPEVKRTPEERAQKAEEIKRRLERSEEILQAEDELIRAASKVKPRIGTG
ncbi:MAG: hypothetical protein FGF53_09355 [Candidatus Brockarchaeota archaeon]|nr:hypothetical protein [Candidatus Brockarchaeota archaeon]